MSTSATNVVTGSFSALRESTRSLLLRVALVPVFVALCYCIESFWWPLRVLTTSTLVGLSVLLHVPMVRIGADLVSLAGMQIQFITPCTMVDAYFGAMPLLWRTSMSTARNLLRLAILFVAIFGLNIFRLEIGFVALDRGVPWWLAHECVAGVAYFCLFLIIARERAWDRSSIERRVLPA